MIHLRASTFALGASADKSRCGGQGGFSLLELLVATAISMLFAAAVAAVVPPLRAFFEQTPAAIDLQQRGRTAVDVIAQAVRAADQVTLSDQDHPHDSFRQLTTLAPAANAALGVLADDQADPDGELFLSDTRCPHVPDVCGFVRDSLGAITDGSGVFEVFSVKSVDAAARSLTPRRLDQPYAAGATVVEVDVSTFRLDPQPDGSSTLVRETGTGAVQPIVDRVSELRFERTFDARGIAVSLTLQPLRSGIRESTHRIAILARNQ